MPEASDNVDDIMCIPAVGILSYHWFLTVRLQQLLLLYYNYYLYPNILYFFSLLFPGICHQHS